MSHVQDGSGRTLILALTKANGVDGMKNLVSRFIKDESGATAIEYGLIAALIAVVIIAGVTTLGANLNTTFTNLSGNVGGTVGNAPAGG